MYRTRVDDVLCKILFDLLMFSDCLKNDWFEDARLLDAHKKYGS